MEKFKLFYHEYWREIWLFIATFATIIFFGVFFAPDPTLSHLFIFGIMSMAALLFISCALVPKNADDSRWGIFGVCWLLCVILLAVNDIIWAYRLQYTQSTGTFIILTGLSGVLTFLLGVVWQNAIRKTASNQKNPPKYDSKTILYVVENEDPTRTVPSHNFCLVTPSIHLVSKALKRVNHYGNLTRAYAETLVQKYEYSDFPFEIEKAAVNLEDTNLIYYLTYAGHCWSAQAQKLMQQNHPLAYQHNVAAKKQAIFYLAERQSGDWSEAQKATCMSDLDLFERLGFVCRIGKQWQITESGRKCAEFYRKSAEE